MLRLSAAFFHGVAEAQQKIIAFLSLTDGIHKPIRWAKDRGNTKLASGTDPAAATFVVKVPNEGGYIWAVPRGSVVV